MTTLTHGHSRRGKRTPESHAYSAAKARCQNPKNPQYKNYGGRGIKFLFNNFQEFLDGVGLKPSKDLTLDRIDNDGNYELGNVRWATPKEQANNQRYFKRYNRWKTTQ